MCLSAINVGAIWDRPARTMSLSASISRRTRSNADFLCTSHDHRITGNRESAGRYVVLTFAVTMVPAVVIAFIAVIKRGVFVRFDMLLPRITQIGGSTSVRIAGDIGIRIFLRLAGRRRRLRSVRSRRSGGVRRRSAGRGSRHGWLSGRRRSSAGDRCAGWIGENISGQQRQQHSEKERFHGAHVASLGHPAGSA